MKQKLLIIVSNLRIGGAQRFIVNLANDLYKQYEIKIIGIHNSEEPNFIDELSSKILYYSLNKRAIKSIGLLSNAIGEFQPDIIFSTQSYINSITLLAKWKSRHACRVIIREASIISNKKSPIFYAAKFLYKRADKIIAQTSVIQQEIIRNFNCRVDSVVVLPNYIDSVKLVKRASGDVQDIGLKKDTFKFLFCGRLEQVKNVDKLLKVLVDCNTKEQEFEFWIVGDGSQRSVLEAYCSDNKIDFVRFFGFKKNPYPYMKEADCLLLASDREGFPNVVVEAMSLGCIVLTNDFKGGAANDILKDQLSQYIYQDKLQFKELIMQLLNLTKKERINLKSKFEDRSLDYKKENILKEYLT